MALTRVQLVQRVLGNVGRTTTGNTSTSVPYSDLAVQYLNEAQYRVSRLADFLWTEATTSTVASQQSYAMPDRMRALYSLRLQTGDSYARKLIMIQHNEMDTKMPEMDIWTTGIPTWYVPYYNNTFDLFRIPDKVYTIRARYSYWPADLTADNQTSDLSASVNCDDVLLADAIRRMFRYLQENADAADWEKEFDARYAEFFSVTRERPDWYPKGAGFSTPSNNVSIGEYYNDPLVMIAPDTYSP